MKDQAWNPIRPAGDGLEAAPLESWLAPIRWKVPRSVRVCTTADLFDRRVGLEAQASVFAVMAAAPGHRFRVVARDPYRMLGILGGAEFWDIVRAAFPSWLRLAGVREERVVELPLPNVELGVLDDRLDDRLGSAMRAVPARRRFVVSVEGREYDLPPEGEIRV